MTKNSPHQWPTNGATRAYVDSAVDRLTARVDRLVAKNRLQTASIRALEDALVARHGAGRRD